MTTSGSKTFSPMGNYTFNGTAAQTTGTLLPNMVSALTINNSANVSLTSSTSVTNALTLAAGKLLLADNNLSAASVAGGSLDRYLVTNGTGALTIRNIGATNTVFPVGPTTGSYNPATINNAGTVDNFSVNVKNSFDQALANPDKAVTKQWDINEETAGGSNVTLGLSWITADQGAGFNPAGSVGIIHFDGVAWTSTAATVTGAGTTVSPYVAMASGLSDFSPFGVANPDAVLPLKLISFNATSNGTNVDVQWSVTNADNLKQFVIEKSTDGRTFTSVNTTPAKNTVTLQNYSVNGIQLPAGRYYFRLKTIDLQNNATYSQLKVVVVSAKTKLVLMANPVKNQLMVKHIAATAGDMFKIVSVDGKVVAALKVKAGETITSIDISNLHAGAYVVVYQTGPDVQTTKFIKE